MIQKEDVERFRETCEPHQLWWSDEQVARHLNEHPLPPPNKPQILEVCEGMTMMTTKEVLDELAKRGLRPATMKELIDLKSYVPYLGWDDDEWRLGQEWEDRSYHRFLTRK